jgi:hypothetical protein
LTTALLKLKEWKITFINGISPGMYQEEAVINYTAFSCLLVLLTKTNQIFCPRTSKRPGWSGKTAG